MKNDKGKTFGKANLIFISFLEKFYYPFVKYRLHISLIFLFLIINAYQWIIKEPVDWPVAISFFLWHYALYIFDRAYDYERDKISQPQEAIRPSEYKFFIWLAIIFCLLPLIILPLWSKSVLPYLPFLPITFLYTYPIYKGIRTKNITFLKNLYSALLIWTLPLAFIIYFYGAVDSSLWEIFKNNFLGLFVYVLIGEAFWDIRDMKGDEINKVKTLPLVIGVLATKIYLVSLILVDYSMFGKSVTDSTIIYLFLIIIVNRKTPNWVYHLPALLALYRFIKPLIL